MIFRARFLSLIAVLLTLAGCQANTHFKNADVLSYVSPAAPQEAVPATELQPLHFPLSVGVAFTPGEYQEGSALTETVKLKLAQKLANALAGDARFGPVVVIPAGHLRPAGGFANLEEIRNSFNIEAILLVSYDQVGFTDQGASTVMYLTLIGAYFVQGEKNSTETALNAALYDIPQHALLLSASGSSRVASSATPVGSSRARRDDAEAGLDDAADKLAANLKLQFPSLDLRAKPAP